MSRLQTFLLRIWAGDSIYRKIQSPKDMSRLWWILQLLYKSYIKRQCLWDMSRLQTRFIKDMSRRQNLHKKIPSLKDMSRLWWILQLLYKSHIKRLCLWDMSRLQTRFIKDMSRRQNIQKNTKSKGYEPAMMNIATTI